MPQKLGVTSGLHAGFSYPEGSAELQMAWFPPVWQTQSWGVTEESLISPGMNLGGAQSGGLGGQASVHESLYTPPRFMLRAEGHGRSDVPVLMRAPLRVELRA